MPVLEEFRHAIAVQQRKSDESYDEQMEMPIDERVAKGITMNNLRVEFDFYDHAPNQWCPLLRHPIKFIRSVTVFCDNNISKFREGAQVILSNAGYRFKMEIIEDSIENFILAPNDFDIKHCYINSESYNSNNWEINTVKTDFTQKLLSATAGSLEHDPQRLEKIEKILEGTLTNNPVSAFQYNGLNSSQNNAVERAMVAPNFFLIQGPPGTGKTKTIAHIARLLVEEGKKVFITAPTHTAINNCLNAVSEEIQDLSKVVKIGEKHQASEILGNPYITRKTRLPLDRYSYNTDLSHDGIVICGTAYCMCYPASKRLNNWEFDVALIDEAAQMSIPLAVSVMSKTDKFIFVGDHKQLDPIIPKGTGLSMFSESIFKKLVGLYPNQMALLKKSYRLNEPLIRIPNALFYSNELTSDESLSVYKEYIRSANYDSIINHDDPKILYLHKEFDSQGRSPHEAKIVSEIVADFVEHGIDEKDIGILTPYRAQVREIKKALHERSISFDEEDTASLFVDTVDRMQGQERDFIIYSMSNSHPLESKRRLDFFYSPNRLNVAITRGIKKCIVIANYKVFDIIDEELLELPDYSTLQPSLEIFKEYHRLSTKIEEERELDSW